ncbi:efflux transporter outer membrane subunit [bacterium]|nr:efflux transporter outer membrane subunit [bacterium]
MKVELKQLMKLFTHTLLIAFALTACTVHEPSKDPEFPLKEDRYINSQTIEKVERKGKWWDQFQSGQLDDLIEQAFQKNRSLKILQAKIEQTLAAFGGTKSSVFPSIDAGLSAGRSQSTTTGTDGSIAAVQSNSFSLSLSASYDFDLFGKNAALVSAAELELLAAMEDYKGLLVEVAADVTRNWLGGLEILSQIELLEQSLIDDRENLTLVTNGYHLGTSFMTDVMQAQQQVLLTQSQIPVAKAKLIVFEHNLSSLVGNYPGSILKDTPDVLFREFPEVKAGLPSDLIKRRPDVRAALTRIKIADFQVASAIAARFPRVSLSASTGTSSDSFDGIFEIDNLIWNLVGNITLPILDAGRRKSEVERQKAILRERVLNYQTILYQAFREVEENLIKIDLQQEQINLIKQRLELSSQNVQLIKQDYAQGLVDWPRVLVVQSQYVDVQKTLITSRKDLLDLKITLLTALGGKWTDDYLELSRKGP